MIVCMCNGVTDRDILCAISRGIDTVEMLTDELNIANVCGVCQYEIEDLIQRNKKPENKFLSIIRID